MLFRRQIGRIRSLTLQEFRRCRRRHGRGGVRRRGEGQFYTDTRERDDRIPVGKGEERRTFSMLDDGGERPRDAVEPEDLLLFLLLGGSLSGGGRGSLRGGGFRLRAQLRLGGRRETRDELDRRLLVRHFLRRRRRSFVRRLRASLGLGLPSSVRRRRRRGGRGRGDGSVGLGLHAEVEGGLRVGLHVVGHHLLEIGLGRRLEKGLEELRIDVRRSGRRRCRCRGEGDVRRFLLVEMEEVGQLFGQDPFLVVDLESSRGDLHSEGRSEVETRSFEESKDEFHVLGGGDVFLQLRVQHQTNLDPLQIRGEGGASLATTGNEREG